MKDTNTGYVIPLKLEWRSNTHISLSYVDQVFGNDRNKSKFDSGGNQEEIEFW
jgi:hypothetical protein